MSVRAALGLGSNLGDRRARIDRTLERLRARDDVAVVAVSPVVETEPRGGPPQPPYLNAAVVVETALDPRGLLGVARALEEAEGRTRGVRWGPRTLDVDVLLCGDETVDEPDLVVPHPRLAERAFVLGPLAAIAPDWVVPGTGRTVEELHADLCHGR